MTSGTTALAVLIVSCPSLSFALRQAPKALLLDHEVSPFTRPSFDELSLIEQPAEMPSPGCPPQASLLSSTLVPGYVGLSGLELAGPIA